jgi:hypothetical protein
MIGLPAKALRSEDKGASKNVNQTSSCAFELQRGSCASFQGTKKGRLLPVCQRLGFGVIERGVVQCLILETLVTVVPGNMSMTVRRASLALSAKMVIVRPVPWAVV